MNMITALINGITNFFKLKYNLVLYFLITVVFFGSIGVWLPMLIDWFNNNPKDASVKIITDETYHSTPNNIITYFLSVFSIALIDRILYIIDKKDYKHRKTEIFASLIIVVAVAFFVLKSFKLIKANDIENAIQFSIYGALISYAIWWIANFNDTKSDPSNSLGGNPQNSLSNG